jgi:RimJ/RimL family protein N-acetyltransferase
MLCRACTFETDRLLAKVRLSLSSSDWQQQDLARVVAAMLTEPVTRLLPTSWQGSYTVERAREWMEERDDEGTTLLVVDKSTHQVVGLMLLFEMNTEDDGVSIEVRLGYLLSESAWGKGFASELVKGFVDWCREQPAISSIAGGVAHDNPASKRVLEKNGFCLIQREDEVVQNEQFFRLQL